MSVLIISFKSRLGYFLKVKMKNEKKWNTSSPVEMMPMDGGVYTDTWKIEKKINPIWWSKLFRIRSKNLVVHWYLWKTLVSLLVGTEQLASWLRKKLKFTGYQIFQRWQKSNRGVQIEKMGDVDVLDRSYIFKISKRSKQKDFFKGRLKLTYSMYTSHC